MGASSSPYPFPCMNESTSSTSGEYSNSKAPKEDRRECPPPPDDFDEPPLLPSGVEWWDSAARARAASASASTRMASTGNTEAAADWEERSELVDPVGDPPLELPGLDLRWLADDAFADPCPPDPSSLLRAWYRCSSCDGAHPACGKSRCRSGLETLALCSSAEISALIAWRWSSINRSRASSLAASRSAATARDARA